MAKRTSLSEHQIHLIAKALADPRRHEILQQIGASKDSASCTDIRGCQPVTAALSARPAHFGRVALVIGKPVS
jgi:ArsR family transcriptional regulator